MQVLTFPLEKARGENVVLQIRPLASDDYKRGHLDLLRVLTVVTDPGEAAWTNQFNALRAQSQSYYTIVIVDKNLDKIVAIGTVFIERKFIRGLGSAGHIEDIAVDKAQQGKKLGLRIIEVLTHISETVGCYKTVLNCSDDNIREFASSPWFVRLTDFRVSLAFYEKCGYTKKEVEMVRHSLNTRHFQCIDQLQM
jgi:glucosamine-phosphate N-acetyltransferase